MLEVIPSYLEMPTVLGIGEIGLNRVTEFCGFPKDFPRLEQFKILTPNWDNNFAFAFGNNRRIGISTRTLTKQLADFFGVQEGGVLISSVSDDSPAAKAGLRAGDIITAVDGEKLGRLRRSLARDKQKRGSRRYADRRPR